MTKRKCLRLLALLLCCLLLTSCGAKPAENSGAAILPTAAADEPVDPNKKTTGVGFYFDTVVYTLPPREMIAAVVRPRRSSATLSAM